jgi:hypothetical protein
VIFLLVILGIAGVGAASALTGLARVPDRVESRLWTAMQLASTLEYLRDTPYAALASGTAASDADYANKTHTVTWTVTEIDPASPQASPPVAKANSGLKRIVVTLDGQSMETWVVQ